MSTIAELAAGPHGRGRLRRREESSAADERKGAPYLALELVDPTGRIEARIWNDVELLDGALRRGRRRPRARPGRALRRQACSWRYAPSRPAEARIRPRWRRSCDATPTSSTASSSSWRPSSRIRGCVRLVGRVPRGRRDPEGAPRAPGAPRLTTPTPAGCSSTPSASRRSRARRRSCTRACAATSCSAAALLHDVGRVRELGRGPSSGRPTRADCSVTSISG